MRFHALGSFVVVEQSERPFAAADAGEWLLVLLVASGPAQQRSTLAHHMKSPTYFLIPRLVISTCLIGSQGYAQQSGQMAPGTNSWQADEEAGIEMTKKLRVVPAFGDYLGQMHRNDCRETC
jgi:hypothetical protein